MPNITYREGVSQALWEEMERDERVFIMGEEVGVWGGSYAVTRGFYDHFGAKRVRDTPIAEGVIAGCAAGAAMAGLRPVAEMMTINFALLAADQIINTMAKVRFMFGGQFQCPMVLRATSGAGRQLGATHSQNLEVLFAHVPGLKVVAPSTPRDAKGLLKAAIRSDDPVVFIEHAALYPTRGEVPAGEFLEEIGKSDVKRPGRDVTIIAYSKTVLVALEAAQTLAKEGIEAEVVDLRTLRPLDLAPIVESFKKTNRAVIVEEDWGTYGIGAEVAARVYEQAFDYLDAPIKRVAQTEVPLPYNQALEQMALPSAANVVAAVRELV